MLSYIHSKLAKKLVPRRASEERKSLYAEWDAWLSGYSAREFNAPRALMVLIKHGYTPSRAARASDRELLSLRLFGVTSLSWLREAQGIVRPPMLSDVEYRTALDHFLAA